MGSEPETLPLPGPPTPATTPKPPALASAAVPAPAASLAPGFRFHPTDEELVIYYLKRKVRGKSFQFDAISVVDIYRSEPWDLADKSRLKTRDQEWYFFSTLDKKYGNGGRMNRATSQGYWKATGNDRPVMHDQRIVGLKKTLVFHSGRAPDGKRTNWVMHEYRLVEEELERAGIGSTQDAYVLCRVFHKNNIGPPNGQRYAPFIEEEWDDASGLVPGAKPVGDVPIAHHPRVENDDCLGCIGGRNNVVQQDTQSINKVQFDINKLPIEAQILESDCKRESMDEHLSPEKDKSNHMDEQPSPKTNNPKTFSQIYKRRRHNLNSDHSDVSGDSIPTCKDPCSSTITTAASTLPMTTMTTTTTTTTITTTNTAPKKHFLSALVELSPLDSLEQKESPSVHLLEFDASDLKSSVPPSCIKFIQNLQSEMRKLSVEKETMRFEIASAQTIINFLHSQIDVLNKENDELKKMIQDPKELIEPVY